MVARIGCMNRVNGGEVEVGRSILIWELLAMPYLEHASEIWWTGGKAACKNLEKIQEKIGRKLVGGSSTVVGAAVGGNLGRRKLEREGKKEIFNWMEVA